jgi:hypothetical protein
MAGFQKEDLQPAAAAEKPVTIFTVARSNCPQKSLSKVKINSSPYCSQQ